MTNTAPVRDEGLERLGIIGAGRLGSVLCSVWTQRRGRAVIWSRNGCRPIPGINGDKSIEWKTQLNDVFDEHYVLVTISRNALRDCTKLPLKAREFEGVLLSAAIDTPMSWLRQQFPKATVSRFAPFLIYGHKSVPMLVLASDESESVEQRILGIMRGFGAVDVVYSESSFERLLLMGSPWPIVVGRLMARCSSVGTSGLKPDEKKIGMQLFVRALSACLAIVADHSDHDDLAVCHTATPGGVTEFGLGKIASLDEEVCEIFEEMYGRLSSDR